MVTKAAKKKAAKKKAGEGHPWRRFPPPEKKKGR